MLLTMLEQCHITYCCAITPWYSLPSQAVFKLHSITTQKTVVFRDSNAENIRTFGGENKRSSPNIIRVTKSKLRWQEHIVVFWVTATQKWKLLQL
jgi:hypothetical protein